MASVGVNHLVCGSCYIGKLFIAGEHIRYVSGMEEWCEKLLMSWYECLCREECVSTCLVYGWVAWMYGANSV